jgi:hypothetical protein
MKLVAFELNQDFTHDAPGDMLDTPYEFFVIIGRESSTAFKVKSRKTTGPGGTIKNNISWMKSASTPKDVRQSELIRSEGAYCLVGFSG